MRVLCKSRTHPCGQRTSHRHTCGEAENHKICNRFLVTARSSERYGRRRRALMRERSHNRILMRWVPRDKASTVYSYDVCSEALGFCGVAVVVVDGWHGNGEYSTTPRYAFTYLGHINTHTHGMLWCLLLLLPSLLLLMCVCVQAHTRMYFHQPRSRSEWHSTYTTFHPLWLFPNSTQFVDSFKHACIHTFTRTHTREHDKNKQRCTEVYC